MNVLEERAVAGRRRLVECAGGRGHDLPAHVVEGRAILDVANHVAVRHEFVDQRGGVRPARRNDLERLG